MLKALELIGFKSFADVTRIEFPAGITVVVGPNGSGKSNIVDAMKWVLGEQSARSLRGKEMADVIYKGSGSGKRKPANTAEATIIFDNTDNVFGMDADEIRVTRRVYRSGEGEYLINNQACRLRDIKDMFRGTGVGADAYSLIEQGKVDSLLQASPRERRAIFEEAAGISRFKAKKIEAQRRLDRVDQNLLRLSDIVEEVDHRLKRLKSQAGKARRYKEYSDRLKQLRTQVGRVDWDQISQRLLVVQNDLQTLQTACQQHGVELASVDSQTTSLEAEIEAVDQQLQTLRRNGSSIREKMAASHTLVGQQRARVVDYAEESQRYQAQLAAMMNRAGDLQSAWTESQAQLDIVEEELTKKQAAAKLHQGELDTATQQLNDTRRAAEQRQSQLVERMQESSSLNQQIATVQSQVESANQTHHKFAEQRDVVEQSLQASATAAAELTSQLENAEQSYQSCNDELSQLHERFEQLTIESKQLESAFIELRQKKAVVTERMNLIEDIERRMEGVGSGVKKLLKMKSQQSDGPLTAICGMVADLIRVTDRDNAEMVAVALGDRAQHLVVAGNRMIESLADGRFIMPGRVGFVRLQSTPPPEFLRAVDLHDKPGVIGRADEFVTAEAEFQHLAEWLLGDTWFVETLADALQFHRTLKLPPRFVTRSGESLDRDGRLLVGPNSLELGLISRRAELVSLKENLQRLDQDCEAASRQWNQSEQQRRGAAEERESLQKEHHSATHELTDLRMRTSAAKTAHQNLQQRFDDLNAELESNQQVLENANTQLVAAQTAVQSVQQLIASLDSDLENDQREVEKHESQIKQLAENATAARVALAKCEQRCDALRAQRDQLQRDHDEREAALAEVKAQVAGTRDRSQGLELQILNATAELAQLAIADQQANEAIGRLLRQRTELQEERSSANALLSELRETLRAAEHRMHQHEMEAERLGSERTVLADRLRDDYGIEVSVLTDQVGCVASEERKEVDEEIAELRRKITNIGTVNMDALEELTDLESRHGALSAQYDDLVEAKENLERIIAKINADSRRLFSETLEAIRVNFQALFRKVFGGGSADIVLEPDVDLLESGIDIVATPPGKQSLGLSLLSGGERALTAVTLLLAIFEYRPSPFCVLDEVDGPLDEANIGRFVDVLREFLKWTKFVVVTHSKKTMTAANTLYGITMQESGVSKKVSVRFEDVSDDGEIHADALRRA